MPRVNIYLPAELARRARDADLNVSRVAQEALELELRRRDLDAWLAKVPARPQLQELEGVQGWQLVEEARAADDRDWDEHSAERGKAGS